MPAVSVIVAVRNGELFLHHALDSVRRQTLTDIEIIVVDDGSTDRTASIIQDLTAADNRIRSIEGPATGSAGAARNAGLDVATGDYLAFLDADDFFAPQLLSRLHRRAEADRADVTVCGFRVFEDPAGVPNTVNWGLRTEFLPSTTPFTPESLGSGLFYAFGPVAWNKLFRTDLIRRHGLRFQELRRSNDLFFTFSALARAERLSYLPRALIDYRVGNPASLQGSADQSPLDFAAALETLQESLRDAGLYERFEAAFVSEAVEVCLANLDRASTYESFRQIDTALRGRLLARFGALDRPPGYFATPGLASRLSAYLDATAQEYLFGLATAASAQARKARIESRAALHEVAKQPLEVTPRLPGARSTIDAPPAPRQPDEPATHPDVSVIVPVHNTAPWLQDCLDGIGRQTQVTLEVICVDDGSTDSSPEVLAQAATEDERLTVIRQENAGLSAARNRGLAQAGGRYVCFVDSDDYWGPDALAELVRAADDARADILLFDADTIAEPGVDERTLTTYPSRYYHRSRSYDEVVPGPVLMARMKAGGDHRVQACLYLIRRSFLEQNQLAFRPGLPREDNLFTFELLLRAERATHRQVSLYTRRLRPGSLITAGSRAAAARGYYISFYEMLRLTAGREFDEETGRQVGATAFKAFKQAKLHFVRLDPDIGDQFASIDPSPDAQAVFRILQLARQDARRSDRKAPPPPPTPLQRARRLAGRGYRALVRLLRR